jgi:hypothetical protein
MVPAGIGMTQQEGRKDPEGKSEAQIPIHFFLKSMKYREFNMLENMAWLLLPITDAELPVYLKITQTLSFCLEEDGRGGEPVAAVRQQLRESPALSLHCVKEGIGVCKAK